MLNVGKELTKWQDSTGITQTAIAKRFGVTQSRVQQLITGKVDFGKKVARQWSDAFGFSFQFLLTGEGTLFENDDRILEQAEEEMKNPPLMNSDIQLIKAQAEIEVLRSQIESLQSQLRDAYRENAQLRFELDKKMYEQ